MPVEPSVVSKFSYERRLWKRACSCRHFTGNDICSIEDCECIDLVLSQSSGSSDGDKNNSSVKALNPKRRPLQREDLLRLFHAPTSFRVVNLTSCSAGYRPRCHHLPHLDYFLLHPVLVILAIAYCAAICKGRPQKISDFAKVLMQELPSFLAVCSLCQ